MILFIAKDLLAQHFSLEKRSVGYSRASFLPQELLVLKKKKINSQSHRSERKRAGRIGDRLTETLVIGPSDAALLLILSC